MASLYLVRHGQASFGARDYDKLSALGLTQSELLGSWLARTTTRPARVVCGTHTRHRQTAAACLGTWVGEALPVDTDPGFDEFDHREILLRAHPEFADPGHLERLIAAPDGQSSFQRLFAQSIARWVGGAHDGEYADSWTEFRRRCREACAVVATAAAAAPGDVWIFTSAGPIAALLQEVLHLPDAQTLDLNWALLNTSVNQFKLRAGKPLLAQFNTVPHLAASARAELLTYR